MCSGVDSIQHTTPESGAYDYICNIVVLISFMDKTIGRITL